MRVSKLDRVALAVVSGVVWLAAAPVARAQDPVDVSADEAELPADTPRTTREARRLWAREILVVKGAVSDPTHHVADERADASAPDLPVLDDTAWLDADASQSEAGAHPAGPVSPESVEQAKRD